ncbi:hypothetical protein [Mesorhizobium sp. B2-4-17]|uniref:hypothetical protein n=1 Tax=Mesorhizobium sp. B2-4-17 TaxID=2589932 RepID=UPI001128A22C|nr:hypothetical protein [Mesorhizobium sp. B2-4-17]TPK78226.1 hypothetical protein FJ548_25170 [Mesorhizobium sp. B2-4-17]
MTELAKIEAEAILSKEAADKAWREMAFKAMSLANHVHFWREVGPEVPSKAEIDGLYRYLDRYDAAQREYYAKQVESLEAGRKWVAAAKVAVDQIGRKL